MVLEHEFWTMANPNVTDFRLLDQAAWSNKPLVVATNNGNPPASNANLANNPNTNDDIRNLYYNQAVADHHFLLTTLRTATDNSSNNWKMFDYIYSYWNREASSWGGPVQHYSGLNLNNASLNLVNYQISNNVHRDLFADFSKTLSDAIFLPYYRSPGQENDYDIASINAPWSGRMYSLLTSSPNAPANIIPLFSAEQPTCVIGYDQYGNLKSGQGKLGSVLGLNNGNNNLKLMETYYYTDHTTKFLPAVSNICPTCATDLNIVGMGWYQLSCILHAETQASIYNATTNGRLNCGSIGGVIGFDEVNEAAKYEIFPNPTNGGINFKGDLKGELVQVYNAQGKLIQSQVIGELQYLEIEKPVPGIYFVKVPNLNISWKIILNN